MPLAPGTRLGPYEIAARIGVDGLGEVYQATDTKLKQQVAIKMLPQSVAADGNGLARFRREAQALASLNHPHIGAIYGLEDADGITALVQVFGEAARQVSRAFSDTHPEIPWADIVGMRHKVVHHYLGVDEDIVCQVVKEDLPRLVAVLEAIAPPSHDQ